MKRIKYLLFIITAFLFPVLVNAAGSVDVINVVEQTKQGDVAVVGDPTFSGLKIDYNLAFNTVGDSITYKATLKNNDKEDYKIENGAAFSKSGYIEYNFNYSDNSNIIKANSTKDIIVTIKYAKAVPESQLTNGEYTETNNMKIILVNNNNVVNPKTSTAYILLIIITVIALVGLSIFLYRKNKKVGTLVLVISLLLPITAYALKTVTVEVNTKIIIEKDPKFCVIAPENMSGPLTNSVGTSAVASIPGGKIVKASSENTKLYSFARGTTLMNWLFSPYYDTIFDDYMEPTVFAFNDTIKCYDEVQSQYQSISSEEEYNALINGLNNCDNEYGIVRDFANQPIKSRAEGCYLYDTRFGR